MATEPDLVISAGFSDAQLVKDANRIVAEFRNRGEQAQKAFQDAAGKVTDTQAARAHMREMDRLAKSYDPVYRAAKTYEKAVKDLDRALDIGAISQRQYAAQVGAAAKQFNVASGAVEEAGRRFSGGGNAMQQVGWQVGDFAVQVGAGTSAAQAFAQQAPQLLGAMGTWGALAGAGVAISVPLGAALYRVATNSETLEDRLKKLNDTTDDYTAKAEAAAAPIEVLRQRYGDLADEVQRANNTMAMVAGVQARQNLIGTAQNVGSDIRSDLNVKRPVGFTDSEFQAFQEAAIEKFLGKTKATTDQVERLQVALDRMGKVTGPEAVLRDGERLLGVFAELATNAEADQVYLGGWIGQLQAVMKAAQDQIKATRSEVERVTEQYQTDTDKLKSLYRDREVAQKALDEAVRSGNEEAIRAWNDRLKLIDEETSKTRLLAIANDELFDAMVRRMEARGESDGFAIFGQRMQNMGAPFQQEMADAAKSIEAANQGIRELIKLRESAGDYNATLDNGAYTGGARDLVNMTINEVLEMQRDMLRHPENTKNSSAAGAYQIVGTTLGGSRFTGDRRDGLGLIGELGLTGNELYDQAMQDRMADQLLRRRRGQGIEGLRNEWQGLENVSPAVIQQALGAQSIPRVDPEIAADQKKALDEQIRERERLAKQAKDYGAQLAQNLLTEQETVTLKTQQADQIAAIRAAGLDPEAEARAIAEVTASIEQQRTVMMLLADAKRRNVDLDTMLAGGSMTYRQAIEALGEAKKAQIITDNERAIAEGKVAESQQLMNEVQERGKQGLLDSIVAGKSFTDVLANMAQMLARAAAEAALFNTGPWASGGTGGGVLGGIWNMFRGGGDALTGALRGAGLPAFGGFRATGGPVSANQVYMTGERGPEPFVPAVNGRILSTAEAQAAWRGDRGASVTLSPSTSIVVQGNADQNTLAQLRRELDTRDRQLRRDMPALMRKHNLTDG